MHLQGGVQNWPSALVAMPDGALFKALDLGLVHQARAHWAAAGRDPRRLITDYRHFDLDGTMTADMAEMKARWRRNFNRFAAPGALDGVDLVEELNEYFSPSDPLPGITSARAAAAVWNAEFRGRAAPQSTRLVIGNFSIGNDVPREYFELALAEDCVLGVHTYTHWQNRQRDPGDWQFHSGRWSFQEAQLGLKPDYAFTETGPYWTADFGWRHPGCLGADRGLLVESMRDWLRDVATTPAYREGRILGPGAWFTSGGGFTWRWYELETPELLALAQMARDEWHPGAPAPTQETDVDALTKARIKHLAQDIVDLADGAKPLYRAEVLYNLTLRDGSGNPISDAEIAPAGFVPKGAILNVYDEFNLSAELPNRALISRDSRRPNVVRSTTANGPALRRL